VPTNPGAAHSSRRSPRGPGHSPRDRGRVLSGVALSGRRPVRAAFCPGSLRRARPATSADAVAQHSPDRGCPTVSPCRASCGSAATCACTTIPPSSTPHGPGSTPAASSASSCSTTPCSPDRAPRASRTCSPRSRPSTRRWTGGSRSFAAIRAPSSPPSPRRWGRIPCTSPPTSGPTADGATPPWSGRSPRLGCGWCAPARRTPSPPGWCAQAAAPRTGSSRRSAARGRRTGGASPRRRAMPPWTGCRPHPGAGSMRSHPTSSALPLPPPARRTPDGAGPPSATAPSSTTTRPGTDRTSPARHGCPPP